MLRREVCIQLPVGIRSYLFHIGLGRLIVSKNLIWVGQVKYPELYVRFILIVMESIITCGPNAINHFLFI